MKVKILDIKWGERAREDYGDIEELADSIKSIGLLNPIIIDEDNFLRAGGRRLSAFIFLEKEEIPARQFRDLTDEDKIEIELHENVYRKNLTWQEEAKLKLQLDTLKKAKAKREDKEWTTEDTAKIFGTSTRNLSREIQLAKAITNDPKLAEEKDKSTALTKLRRKTESITRSLEASVVEIEDNLYHGRAEEEMKKIESNSIDLILFDPPFGENYDKKAEDKGWDNVYGEISDEEEPIMEMVLAVLNEAYRVLKDGAHMYMFFSLRPGKFYELAEMVVHSKLNYQQQPLFWVKPSNHNYQPYQRYTVNYEPFFFIWKGSKPRDLKSQHNATFSFPLEDKKHPAQKPIGLYGSLIHQSAQKGEIVLDPTAGSGMGLVAAKKLGCKVIGIELDKGWFDLIKVNLSKVKRGEYADD